MSRGRAASRDSLVGGGAGGAATMIEPGGRQSISRIRARLVPATSLDRVELLTGRGGGWVECPPNPVASDTRTVGSGRECDLLLLFELVVPGHDPLHIVRLSGNDRALARMHQTVGRVTLSGEADTRKRGGS